MASVLITGGSKGIGAATVEKFYDLGYKVAFSYSSSKEQAKELEQRLLGTVAINVDFADSHSTIEFCRKAVAAIGTPDVLVLNAGVSHFSLLQDHSLEDWDRIMNINLRSIFICTKELAPLMVSKGGGSIITVSSMWGQVGASCEVVYSASKAGIIGFSKALAKELAPSKITVNCVAPGVIATEMNSNLSEETLAALKEETPLNTLGTPQQVAEAICFLAKENNFITGQVLGVNGGLII